MSKRNKFSAGPKPSRHARREDRRTAASAPAPQRPAEGAAPRRAAGSDAGGGYWLYGQHAVEAALANPRRRIQRLLLSEAGSGAGRTILDLSKTRPEGCPIPVEPADGRAISELLPPGAVHQGVAARVLPLPASHVEDVCGRGAARSTVVILDQVTDPQNVGAILRSAAAFGADAVILTDRNAPPETGALAKAASGALEVVPLVRVTNLVRAIDALKEAGFWCAGLAAEASQTLAEARLSGRVALVLGSEGEGLRRLTRERCDILVRLPTGGPIGHLNVSNAAAVALYELARDAAPPQAG